MGQISKRLRKLRVRPLHALVHVKQQLPVHLIVQKSEAVVRRGAQILAQREQRRVGMLGEHSPRQPARRGQPDDRSGALTDHCRPQVGLYHARFVDAVINPVIQQGVIRGEPIRPQQAVPLLLRFDLPQRISAGFANEVIRDEQPRRCRGIRNYQLAGAPVAVLLLPHG